MRVGAFLLSLGKKLTTLIVIAPPKNEVDYSCYVTGMKFFVIRGLLVCIVIDQPLYSLNTHGAANVQVGVVQGLNNPLEPTQT